MEAKIRKNVNKAPLQSPLFYKGAFFAYPLILLLALENSKPQGGFSALLAGPGSGLLVMAVNYLLFLSLVLFFYSLLKDLFTASLAVGGLLFLFYALHYFRWTNTGTAFTPGDFIFVNRIFSIAGFAVLKPSGKLLLALAALALCSLFFYLHRAAYRQAALQGKKRLAAALGSLGCFALFLVPPGQNTLFTLLRVKPDQPAENLYAALGNLPGFLLLTGQGPAKTPPLPPAPYQFSPQALQAQYSPQTMEQIAQEVKKVGASSPGASGVKPNVIVVMSEAYWDPSRLPGVEFSTPPLPEYHRLAEKYPSGNLLTPAIGGLTSNVEYELLLMDSMLFYKPGDVPFERPNQIFPAGDDPLALPRQFKDNGYRTVAVHPFDRNFYGRGSLYPRLGFDSFIAREDMPDAPLRGRYISDEYFTQRMIQEIQQSQEPLFLFGISMENHYPYDPYRYKQMDIQLESALPPPDAFPLAAYTQGVHNADAALGQLVEYLENQEEPTILLFYGDHLPTWENRPLNLYQQTGFISTMDRAAWTLEDSRHMYNTPYLLWSNFDLAIPDIEDFSPLFAGPLLLRAAGLPMSGHAAYLLDSMQYFHGLHQELYIDGQGEYQTRPPDLGGQRLDRLYAIHLDRFEPAHQFGQRYAVDEIAAKP